MALPELTFSRDLLSFIDESPTPYHAAETARERLGGQGFVELSPADSWPTEPGRHLVVDGGSLIAWVVAPHHRPESGFRVVGAHTDSPNLRVKPRPDTSSAGLSQLGVEVYGGVLLNSWLDRDLGLAGRIAVRGGDAITTVLVCDDEPLLRIPQLAIHLDRNVVESGLILDRQRHLAPIWGAAGPHAPSFAEHLAALAGVDVDDILSWDVMLHDTAPAALVGSEGQFLSAPRIDNLLSCHAAVHALLDAADAPGSSIPVVALFDHEEVGSVSSTGAASALLTRVLGRIVERLGGDAEALPRSMASSLVISTDGAHATHPNYPERHEPAHPVELNGGPVLKLNAQERYATNAGSAAVVRRAADRAGVALQTFVSRTDLACGSTIGPVTSAGLGASTADLGVAQLAMHSIRELAGSHDPERLRDLLSALLADELGVPRP